jgi:tripartite-type tricarboxylate transporter receptor subunit TctC
MQNYKPVLSRRSLMTGAVAAVAAAGLDPSNAQAAFPSRLITVVSPFAPGGLNDICSRAVARGLQEAFKQTTVVENRPGGNTLIALEQVARSAPDGHMLITVSDLNMTYLPALVSKANFSIERDFAPVTLLCMVPFLLLVRPGLEANSAADIIKLAKANPGKLSFASGNGAGVAGETFKSRAGLDMVHVPYRSAPQAVNDLLAGRVSLMFTDITVFLPHVQAGALRALATTRLQRSTIAPDLPTLDEAGLTDFEMDAWGGFFAPVGTPHEVVTKLNTELRKIIDSPEIKAKSATLGFEAFSSSPEELGKFNEVQLVKWTKMIKDAGIQPE